VSLRGFEDAIWHDYNGPLWAAVEDIALFCGEITDAYLARRLAA
jgi:hypothetical protein